MTTTNAPTNSQWLHADDDELEMRWEAFLKNKREGATTANSNETGDISYDDREVLNEESRDADERRVSFSDEIFEADDTRDMRQESDSAPATQNIDMFKMFELFILFEKRNWKGLIKHIKSHPQSAFVTLTRGSKGLTLTTTGNLLLHEACRDEPPVEVIDTLLAVNLDAAMTKGQRGFLPLHYACATGSSTEVVEKLLQANPSGTKARETTDLMLPLHIAVKWGASPAVLDALVRSYADGRNARDIYAKIPIDYAYEIVSQDEHDAAIICLTQEFIEVNEEGDHSYTERALFNVNDKPLQEELAIAKTKMDEMSSELDERERKYAILFGHEQEKAQELHTEKEQLKLEKQHATTLQETQAKKLKLLEIEHRTLRNLQETSVQKKALLEKKIEVLIKASEVKQELIQRLEHENNFRYNKELTKSLMAQEENYKHMLQAERERVSELENRATEVEITHRMYTEAILGEHDREAADFEAFTMEFQGLETSLQKQLKDAAEKNQSLEDKSTQRDIKFQEVITAEQAKVAFLEKHISKVNDLLESEQNRFQELEAILKDTIQVENEQKEEMIAEFNQKEEKHGNLLTAERQKIAALEEDYAELRQLLKTESEKVSAFEAYETELKKLIESEQLKLAKLQTVHQKSQKLLDTEREKVATLELSQSETSTQLRSEQQKVNQLEHDQSKINKLLAVERQNVVELRKALGDKQAEYETEKKKVKAVQQTQASRRLTLDSLEKKVALLEAQLEENIVFAEEQQARLEFALAELDVMSTSLQAEKQKVEALMQSRQEVNDVLQSEKLKVRGLEEAQVVAETELLMNTSSDETMEEQLITNQKLLGIERTRVASLKEEQIQLGKRIESETLQADSLKESLDEKEALLGSEKEKINDFEKSQREVRSLLESEQTKTRELQNQHHQVQFLLETEKGYVASLRESLEEAKTRVELKELKLTTLEEAQKEGAQSSGTVEEHVEALEREVKELTSCYDSEKVKLQELEETLSKHKGQLEAEQELVKDLELQLSESTSLFNAEKRKAEELQEANDQVMTELKNEQWRVDSLEQDQARTHVLFDSEQNKARALEHSRDQLQALLEWEQKNLRSRMEKQSELESKLQAAESEIMVTVKTLEEKELDVEILNRQFESFEDIKKRVIKLNTEAKQRDVMLASVLQAIGDDKKLKSKEPVEKARVYVEDLKGIIGLDLAGLDEHAIEADNRGGALVTTTRRDVSRFRRMRRTIYWTIPLIPLVAIAHDPSLIDDISATLDPSMIREMLANFDPSVLREMLANFDPSVLRDMVAGFDPAMLQSLQEPIIQMFGLASTMATGR